MFKYIKMFLVWLLYTAITIVIQMISLDMKGGEYNLLSAGLFGASSAMLVISGLIFILGFLYWLIHIFKSQ